MQIKLILFFLVAFIVLTFVPSEAFADWYDSSWEHRKKITISLNTVISSDLDNFPVLVSTIDTDLIQTTESDGTDIVFTTSDGKTLLDYEIEKFDQSTGELVAWVTLPTLPAASTADIYIYYKGNSTSVNSEDVWNDDYVLVWHLNQTSTGTSSEFKDSTSNGNDGRGGGGGDVGHDSGRIPHLTDGQIGNGQHLKGPTTTGNGEGNGDFIYRNSLNGMPSRDFTIELWVGDIVNVPDGGNTALYNDLVSVCYDAGSTKSQWQNHISLWQSANVKMKIRTDFFVSTANPGHPVQDDNPAAFTNWNHIVAVYNQKDADGTQGNSQLYINGVLVKDENRSGGLNRDNQTDKLRMVLGGDIDAEGGNNCGRVNNELKGKIDELRISSGLRTADYAAASYYNQGDPSTYLSFGGQESEEEDTSKNKCYDCEAPRLVQVQVGITSNKNASDDSMTHVMKEEYAWNFPINDPLSMRDDDITKITANPGDEIEITLDVIDDKSVHLLPTSGIYTNFMERPNDMNLFFVSNFDENHNTSTSFYQWNRNHDDVAYDYADTVTWRNPDISYTQFPVTTQTPFELLNDELVIEHFIISFKMKFTDSMRPSQVWVSAADYYGQTFKVSLPLTLEILGDEPLDFTSTLNQEVLGYFNEPVLLSILHQWNQSSQDVSELSSILGVNGELPPWTANLATWTVEEKITSAEMIIAIEHVINNS